MGYHLRTIQKGKLGNISKVREELEEAEDAIDQDCQIMLLLELSDMIGAIKAVAEQNGSTLEQLITMSELTEKAFKDGTRK